MRESRASNSTTGHPPEMVPHFLKMDASRIVVALHPKYLQVELPCPAKWTLATSPPQSGMKKWNLKRQKLEIQPFQNNT